LQAVGWVDAENPTAARLTAIVLGQVKRDPTYGFMEVSGDF